MDSSICNPAVLNCASCRGRVLIKAGWFGRNGLAWYSGPDSLGEQVYSLCDKMKSEGIHVALKGDITQKFEPDVEVHLDRQLPHSRDSKKMLVYLEPDFVQPQNLIIPEFKYDVVFTLRSDLPLSKKLRRYRYARSLKRQVIPPFSERTILVSCIAGNKNAVIRSPYNLYPARQRYINLLEAKLGDRFSLFGHGWDLVDHPIGLASKALFRAPGISRLFRRRIPRPSYRGPLSTKAIAMEHSIFTLCVENTSIPGAMTEKLIDCFQYGTVPLYMGPPDISEMIPSELYYDLRSFKNEDDLVNFVLNFSRSDYDAWTASLDKKFDLIVNSRSLAQFVDPIFNSVKELLAK